MTRPDRPQDDTGRATPGTRVREGLSTGPADATPPSEALAELVRWEAAGGVWRASSLGLPARVSLLTCDGGEEMEHLESSDPSFIAYLEARVREVDTDAPR